MISDQTQQFAVSSLSNFARIVFARSMTLSGTAEHLRLYLLPQGTGARAIPMNWGLRALAVADLESCNARILTACPTSFVSNPLVRSIIINRGNYRRWIFEESGAKAAFETCLFEACKRCEWLLHAFVIMGNHFHLALETPRGNLVTGMQWLESTYANRFNRFRDEWGHLFQSRYKALLVEPGDALGQLCSYIDLNPVRAGIVSVERLRDHRYV